ncbi:MAG: hypothetical protein ABH843_00290 [Candidatus Omnitrophota bacterium]
MAAVKAKISDKNLIAILICTVLILIFLAYNGNAKLASVVDSNESINKSVLDLNMQMMKMGEKTLVAVQEMSQQRTELEELRKKLTQERLRNVELQGQMEKMISGVSSVKTPAPAPAPASPEVPVS